MANPCVFCGDTSRRLTGEHVFGNWISEFFRARYAQDFNGTSRLLNADGTLTQYPMVPFQQEVRIVCQPCNGGWMRRLEEDVQPILKPMMLGERTRLRAGSQRKLAVWAAKTALVLDYLHPAARVVPDSHYGSFYVEKRPLRSHYITISYRTVPYDDDLGYLLATALKQPVLNVQVDSIIAQPVRDKLQEWSLAGHRMYKVTFAVGQLVVLVFGHDFPLPIRVYGNAPATHIWPVSHRFDWSSEQSIDPMGGVQAFHDSFAPAPKVQE